MNAAGIFCMVGLVLPLILPVEEAFPQTRPANEATLAEQAPDGTIHVYVSRVQIPVLVLDGFRKATAPIPPSDFRVKLQGLPEFAPERVRMEGDDPISLSILLDNSDPNESLWKEFPSSAALLSGSLQLPDTVSLYVANGCKLLQVGLAEHSSEGQLEKRFSAALASAPYRRSNAGDCASPVHLWDAMLVAANQLRAAKGRRVLLVLSNGTRSKDTAVMERLHAFLQDSGVTVLNLFHGSGEDGPYSLRLDDGRILGSASFLPRNPLYDSAPTVDWRGYGLGTESELSGGMIQSVATNGLAQALREAIARIRGRYILEFPRPARMQSGQQNFRVLVRRGTYFVRPAGLTIPVGDPPDESAGKYASEESLHRSRR